MKEKEAIVIYYKCIFDTIKNDTNIIINIRSDFKSFY